MTVQTPELLGEITAKRPGTTRASSGVRVAGTPSDQRPRRLPWAFSSYSVIWMLAGSPALIAVLVSLVADSGREWWKGAAFALVWTCDGLIHWFFVRRLRRHVPRSIWRAKRDAAEWPNR